MQVDRDAELGQAMQEEAADWALSARLVVEGKRLRGGRGGDMRPFFDIATDADLRSRLSPHRDAG